MRLRKAYPENPPTLVVGSVNKSLPEYSFWRLEIFKRAGWTCQRCEAKSRKGEKCILDIHHIYPLSRIISDFGIKTVEEAISCEKLWDTNNGKCLCRNCHKLTDSWGANNDRDYNAAKNINRVGLTLQEQTYAVA